MSESTMLTPKGFMENCKASVNSLDPFYGPEIEALSQKVLFLFVCFVICCVFVSLDLLHVAPVRA